MDPEKILLSVVIPCYNEEEVLGETHRRLTQVLTQPGMPRFELIYVDDGSRDTTPLLLRALQQVDNRVRVVLLSRNFGHQLAVSAGMEDARGDAVVLIDADLQDPPEVIVTMLERWAEGYHVAYGQRVDRAGETAFKVGTAKLFYRLLNRLTETEIPLDTGDFRLMDRKVIDAIASMPERDRFVRAMVSWVGFRQIAVPYQRSPRFAGESKYPLKKMIRFAFDGITSFSRAPLTMAAYLGTTAAAMALIGILYAVGMRLFTNEWVTGWTLLFISVLFMGGVQLICLWLIGEYVGRIFGEVKRRPLFVVQERLGGEESRPATLPLSFPQPFLRGPGADEREVPRREVREIDAGVIPRAASATASSNASASASSQHRSAPRA
ncbi:MAG: glycosyltransferase family 2 protein [Gemmatimonadaceae bacterium]